MKSPIITLAAVAVPLLLSACSDSPEDRMAAFCTGGDDECECLADTLGNKLSDDEYSALLDELESTNESEASKKQVGEKLMSGQLVSEKVSKAFIQSTKACAP